jgi:hypothetical protein
MPSRCQQQGGRRRTRKMKKSIRKLRKSRRKTQRGGQVNAPPIL